MSNYPDGMTRAHWRWVNGPDIDTEEIVFCPVCEVERDVRITGYREDSYVTATCEECDSDFDVEMSEGEY